MRKAYIVVTRNGAGQVFESLPFVDWESAYKFAQKELQQANLRKFSRFSTVSYYIKEVTGNG